MAKLNKLTLNPSKLHALAISPTIEKATTKFLIYLNSTNFNIAKSVKYLGVLINNKLVFDNHINYINHKVSRRVGIITKLKRLLPN